MNIRDAVETDLPAIVATMPRFPAAQQNSDLEPVSVESRLFWFHERLPSYRPIWVMRMTNAQHLRRGSLGGPVFNHVLWASSPTRRLPD